MWSSCGLASVSRLDILWTNIDLTLEQKGALRAAMLKGIGSRDTAELYTDVVGAAELAAFLNDLPHLRSAFFATIAYQDWGRALEAHRRQSIPIDPTSALPPLIGREGTLSQLRDLVDLASVRAIVVTGPHMIGKTRLVLGSHAPSRLTPLRRWTLRASRETNCGVFITVVGVSIKLRPSLWNTSRTTEPNCTRVEPDQGTVRRYTRAAVPL